MKYVLYVRKVVNRVDEGSQGNTTTVTIFLSHGLSFLIEYSD